MSTTAGQAAKDGARHAAGGTGRMLHRIVQLALALTIVAAAGLGALAVRLSQGPLDIAWAARRLTAMANAADSTSTIAIGGVALAWEGLHGGLDMPLDLVLRDVSVKDPAGTQLALVPKAAVSLVMGELLRGQLAFRTIALDGVRLKLRRAPDGTMSLDLGAVEPPAEPHPGSPDPPAPGPSLIQTLTAPPGPATQHPTGIWSHLLRLRIDDFAVSVADQALGLAWSLPAVTADFTRAAGGGAAGTARITAQAGPETLQLDTRLALLANAKGLTLSARLGRITPSRLAALSPTLAPLAALDAPMSVSATLSLDSALALRTATLKAELDQGTLHLGTGIMPIRAATLHAEATPDSLNLHLDRLTLQARDEAPPTNILIDIAAKRAAGSIDATVSVDLDQVAFADLPALWPEGVGGPGTRPWITRNITAGLAHNGHVALALTAPDDLSDATVTAISGGIDGSDVTGHWLRPVPPIEHGETHVVFVDPDTMDVLITEGRQSGSRLALRPSKVRLTGIAGHDQAIAMQADLFGPFADLIALLRHPKIRLLDRRPIDLRDPQGQVTGALTVSLPLKNDLDIDNVAIHAVGKLAGGHLGGTAAGRDVDRAALAFDVTNDGLQITGTADLAAIPSALKIDMDFRAGPPDQILQRIGVTATVEPRQITAAGLDTQGVLTGAIPLQLDYVERRDTTADVSLKADLARAGVEGGRFPWRKAEGKPATIDAHVLLKAGRLASIERVRAEGPGLSVLMAAETASGHPNLVRIQRLVIGETTDVTGEIRLPERAGQPYGLTFAGSSLDVSSLFDRKSPPKADTDPDAKGPAYKVDARLGRVLLAGGRALTQVTAKAENDGHSATFVRMAAVAGSGPVSISISPQRGGRALDATAADAGAMLRTIDVMQTMRGGTLAIHGSYDDTRPDHPLTGTAEIADFRILDAPAVGRLLQAMSLYGLVEMAQGPGLGFTRLVAPFQLRREVLTLENARAFSASLGVTVKGTVDLAASQLALEGTVIPAYFFNSLLGRVPLLGKLFSPETGGGLFAATYAVRGPTSDPAVSVNPLAALTPGFLRGFFDIFEAPAKPGPPQSSPPSPTVSEQQK